MVNQNLPIFRGSKKFWRVTLHLSGKRWANIAKRDLTGCVFGRLTVLEPTEKRVSREVVWRCRCSCGKEVDVRSSSLTGGHTTSCGCVKRELDDQRDFKKLLTFKDGTCIEILERIDKPRADTSPETGVRGVRRLPNGHYTATLTFRGVRHHLGTYPTIEEAAEARRQGEKQVQQYLEGYKQRNKEA